MDRKIVEGEVFGMSGEKLKNELRARGLPLSGGSVERKKRLVQAILDGIEPVENLELAAVTNSPATGKEAGDPYGFFAEDSEVFNIQDEESRDSPVLGLAANQEVAAA